jgi:MFS transporter, putative metabolite:H+ symporter
VGSGNYLKPDVPLPEIPPAFVYPGCWFLMAGTVYYFVGLETRGKSIEQINRELAVTALMLRPKSVGAPNGGHRP